MFYNMNTRYPFDVNTNIFNLKGAALARRGKHFRSSLRRRPAN